MKSILKNALMGLLLIAGTTKPVVTEDQVKTALINIIPADGTITNETFKEFLGDINWSAPMQICSKINTALEANADTKNKNVTSFTSLYGYLPYMKVISVDATTNTSKKLIVIAENNIVIYGIIFTITTTTATAEYKKKADTETLLKVSSLQSVVGLANRGVSLPYIPKENRGPIYTGLKYIGYVTAAYLAYLGSKKLLNWCYDVTPLINEITDLKKQVAGLMSLHAASIAPTAIVAPAATTAAAAANTVLTKVVAPASKGFIENAIAVGKEIIKRH